MKKFPNEVSGMMGGGLDEDDHIYWDEAFDSSFKKLREVAKRAGIPYDEICEEADIVHEGTEEWSREKMMELSEPYWDRVAHPQFLLEEILNS